MTAKMTQRYSMDELRDFADRAQMGQGWERRVGTALGQALDLIVEMTTIKGDVDIDAQRSWAEHRSPDVESAKRVTDLCDALGVSEAARRSLMSDLKAVQGEWQRSSKEVERLTSEVARIKAEHDDVKVSTLRKQLSKQIETFNELQAEIQQLKSTGANAEVERLKTIIDANEKYIALRNEQESNLRVELERLKSSNWLLKHQNETLVLRGDVAKMRQALDLYQSDSTDRGLMERSLPFLRRIAKREEFHGGGDDDVVVAKELVRLMEAALVVDTVVMSVADTDALKAREATLRGLLDRALPFLVTLARTSTIEAEWKACTALRDQVEAALGAP